VKCDKGFEQLEASRANNERINDYEIEHKTPIEEHQAQSRRAMHVQPLHLPARLLRLQ
jgi:hypothetical protein